MRLFEYGDTNKFQKTVRINHPSTGALFWGGLFIGIKKARVGVEPSEQASFVGPKFTRKGFGWPLKTKMEKWNHDSFGKLKSILKAPPIF